MLQPNSPPPAMPHPWDELEKLDARHRDRLLETQAEIVGFFKKHPYFESDPICRLARQMCVNTLSEHERHQVDWMVTNSGYELGRPMHPCVVRGPDNYLPNGAQTTNYLDFLTNSNRPRPLWMAWYPLARAAIEAQKELAKQDG